MRPIATLGPGERRWCMVHRAIGEEVCNQCVTLVAINSLQSKRRLRDSFTNAAQQRSVRCSGSGELSNANGCDSEMNGDRLEHLLGIPTRCAESG